MTNLFLYSFFIAVVWWVYINILISPDMLMSYFHGWLDRVTAKVGWYPNKLINCEYCLAGFTSAIGFPILFDYNLWVHIVFISLSVFYVQIFNKFLVTE